MEKPISVVINDMKAQIIQAIQQSQLPAAVVDPVLKDMVAQISVLNQQQTEKDIKYWNQELEIKQKENQEQQSQNIVEQQESN